MVKWRYVIAGLLAVPLVDAFLLVFVADALGAIETVALVVLTGLIGTLLVRAEGRHTVRKLQDRVARGEAPTDELLDGAFLIAAGALLLTPGLVTDAIGFAFVVPVTRYPIREVVDRYVVTPYLDEKVDGFVTGNVYTGGFPNGAAGPGAGPGGSSGPGPGNGPRSGSGPASGDGSPSDGDVYDVDDDDYSVK